MKTMYEFGLTLSVFDPQQLLAAAQAHPDSEGIELLDGDEVIITACLAVLLDPGSLAGCDIDHHDVESWDEP